MKSRVLVMVCGVGVAACFSPVEETNCIRDVDCGGGGSGQRDSGSAPVDGGDHDAGAVDSGTADAAVSDAGSFDAGPIDAGPIDAGPIDAGPIDAGPIDAGPFDAGPIDAGLFDAGGVDAGEFDAGPPRCSAASPCLPTGYKFGLAPECGVFCYYDEAHNLAINGPGQGQNPAGFAQYAPGQLLDGVRGNPDWTVNTGSGYAFEWVGWLYRDASIVFQFPTSREFSAVTVGVNNRGHGAVYEPPEIRVQFGEDGVNFGGAYIFRRADGTLTSVPIGARQDVTLAVPGAMGRFIRFTLVNPSAWSMVDEFEFD